MQYTEFESTFLTYLLGQSSLTNLIGDRAHFFLYETVVGLTFPAITFQMTEGSDYLSIVRTMPVTAYSHSDKHFDEANTVMDIVIGLLRGALLGGKLAISVTGNPIENYIAKVRLYSVNVPLRVIML